MEKLTMQEASEQWFAFERLSWANWKGAAEDAKAGKITWREEAKRVRRIRESRHIAYSLLFGIHATL